ncbi:MAG: peptide deformylase [Firmicutes bacterium]|nr:peptide deformylase [Bacillota bacterium]
MIRSIIHDTFFLSQKSEPATASDLSIARDLRDTLAANRDRCVGMAANMIGQRKRMIIVTLGMFDLVMLNPEITKKADAFEAEEGCLSLSGTRRTTRYRKITVRYQDEQMKVHVQEFSGWTAQIIQHECDHLDGILI